MGRTARLAGWLLILAAVLAASRLLPEPLPCRVCTRALAALLLGLSITGASVSGRYLRLYGKSRPDLGFGELDKLVTKGPYSCMRHPMHFSLSLIPPALGLATGTLGGLAAGIATQLLVLALAVLVDEKDALARFGEEYTRYRERVPAFNPSPRCLARLLKPPRRRTVSHR